MASHRGTIQHGANIFWFFLQFLGHHLWRTNAPQTDSVNAHLCLLWSNANCLCRNHDWQKALGSAELHCWASVASVAFVVCIDVVIVVACCCCSLYWCWDLRGLYIMESRSDQEITQWSPKWAATTWVRYFSNACSILEGTLCQFGGAKSTILLALVSIYMKTI